jgi:HlyD family secretion protein
MKRILITLGILLIVIFAAYYIYQHFRCKNKLMLYGNVDIRDVNLSFRVDGRLLKLKVDEGDVVHPGELIAQLDPEPYVIEVNAAKATVKQNIASLCYAKITFERQKKLLEKGVSTPDQYDNALASRDRAKAARDKAIADLSQSYRRLRDTYLFVPSEGTVLVRAVEPGTVLQSGATVITVSLKNPVWVRAYVDETQLAKVKYGTRVKVFSDSLPHHYFEGKVGFISPQAEFTPKTVESAQLRTELVYRLRIVMQDPKHQLLQGMPVTVEVLK